MVIDSGKDMRELIYYVATTLDGLIAEADGSIDGFPVDDEFIADLVATLPETFPASFHDAMETRAVNRCFDTVLMGRRTYEVGLKAGLTNPYPSLKQYVFSRTMTDRPDEQIEVVSAGAGERVEQLKQSPGKSIWLCGGGTLAAALAASGLIDRIIVKLNPILLGSGIPLFAGELHRTALDLTDCKTYASGHIMLQYRVKG